MENKANQICKKMTNSCGEFIIYLISLSFIPFAWLLWRISRYCSVQDIEDPSGREQDERRQIYKRSNITKASLVLQTILPLQPSLSPEFPNQHQRWHHRIFCKLKKFFLPKLIFKNWQEMGFSQLERKNYKDISKKLCFANMVWH